MNVINLNIEFDYFTFLLIHKSSDTTLYLLSYLPYQDSKSVLWYKNNVILHVMCSGTQHAIPFRVA